ncbi:MAG: protein kinase [Oceanospirillaceae bacterium]|nr:protein kinase [Oceanospirillaceae bacterium]|tara:strand:+ start:80606 stop:82345 length:1740 start_codon:yes stop_codon:yes gene_type:complete
MPDTLQVSVGQATDKGVKPLNQDFHAVQIPASPLLESKGIAMALADGISSSSVSQIASATAVQNFLSDYYCTSEAWSVKTSGLKVLAAANSWLYAQTRQSQYRHDMNRGYVCTFSAIVIKSRTLHLFHAGDTRVYQVQGDALEPLTKDHRFYTEENKSYLTRALGMDDQLEIDYRSQSLDTGDTFVLATDGIYEFVDDDFVTETLKEYAGNLDQAAQVILDKARANKSDDNLTIQILRVDQLPAQSKSDVHQQLTELPFPPELDAREEFDGYTILRKIHASPRSHVFLARDNASGVTVILKTPSGELREDTTYLERFLLEEWIARRINSPHVLKPVEHPRKPNYIYLVTEFIEGITLAQWMRDNPRPAIEKVRDIVVQIARGLRAFHRLEMLHQDLKPDNIMIDSEGTVKIIDFGAVRVAGLLEVDNPLDQDGIRGTAQYSAPEYFLGSQGSIASDVYSLGAITYEMLTGRLPYGAEVARISSVKMLQRLSYTPAFNADDPQSIPRWADYALRKCLQPEPHRRYQEADEFVHDLMHPNKGYLQHKRPPLIERNPVQFWQGVSGVLLIIVLILLYRLNNG